MTYTLKAQNITKKFKTFTALDNFEIEIQKGEIVGLLGPNGAGKTTAIQIMLGILSPTSGEVYYFDKPLSKFREEILERVNYSSTYVHLPNDLSVIQCLNYTSYLYDIKNRSEKIQSLIKRFRLENLSNLLMKQLSEGQNTRVNLAKAFINEPEVLLLDEPTASLDPDIASDIRKYLLQSRNELETSMLITSHNMSEIEEVCDRVVIIQNGKVIENDTPKNLSKKLDFCHLVLSFPDPQDLDKTSHLANKMNLKSTIKERNITIDINELEVGEFLATLVRQGLKYTEISIEKPTLEDYFLQISKSSNENS